MINRIFDCVEEDLYLPDEIQRLNEIEETMERQLSKEDFVQLEPNILECMAEQSRISFRHGFLAASRLWMEIIRDA